MLCKFSAAPKTPTSSRSAPGDHEFNASNPQSTRLVPGRDRCRAQSLLTDGQAVTFSDDLSGTERAVRELIQLLVEQLVNNPGAVEVKEAQVDAASVIELRVAKEDFGRVIGKQGRTVESLRTILNAVAARNNRKVILQIIE